MTIIASIPVRRLGAGTHAIPPIQVPAGITRLGISVERQNWPATADTLASGTLEFSHDGVNFRPILTLLLNGLPDEDENGNPAPDSILSTVHLGGVTFAGGFVRGSVTLSQALRVGAALEVF